MINNSIKKEKDLHSGNIAKEEEELDKLEELNIKIDVLVELLSEKGIINKKMYVNNLMMYLHQSSKAKSFENFDQEI
ncbi:MAG: hypothetical protein MRJ93_09720 [Nitrososphaeraceae archaeon]|nr:hypothetical protein [Nitrososphaeraceae archaeon]